MSLHACLSRWPAAVRRIQDLVPICFHSGTLLYLFFCRSLWEIILGQGAYLSSHCPFVAANCPRADGPVRVIFSFLALKRTFLYQTWVFSRVPASNSSFAFGFLWVAVSLLNKDIRVRNRLIWTFTGPGSGIGSAESSRSGVRSPARRTLWRNWLNSMSRQTSTRKSSGLLKSCGARSSTSRRAPVASLLEHVGWAAFRNKVTAQPILFLQRIKLCFPPVCWQDKRAAGRTSGIPCRSAIVGWLQVIGRRHQNCRAYQPDCRHCRPVIRP